MTRYMAKPLFVETPLWDDSTPMIPSISVCEHKAKFTGLLDAKGEEIWRAPRPVGFGRDGEW